MLSYANSAFWAGTTYLSVIVSMLVRNIIFARLLSPGDFSIALTFGVVLSFFEYLSNFGHEIFMQRSHDGDDPRFQANMHSFMLLSGFIVSLFIVLISPAIPIFFKLPQDTFNYALLAIVPLINGFAHLDPQRAHRQNDYKLTAKIGFIADLSSIFVALISIVIWEDYWAFYISFVFRHSISTLLSHAFASRPYQLAINKTYFLSLWKFGLPLIFIGVLKYSGTEFDKALIARYIGLTHFTLYFLTIMVTAKSANIISIGLTKIFVRRISLSSAENLSNTVFENGIISLYLVLPILFTITLFGEHIILLVFGHQYPPIPYLFPAVVILVACRQLSSWLNQIVVGSSDPKLMLYADVLRVVSLIIMIPIIMSGQDVRLFALTFAVSEVVYILYLSKLVSNSIARFKVASLILLSITVLSISCFVAVYWLSYNSSLMMRITYYSTGLLTLLGLFNYYSHTCRKETIKLVKSTLTRLKQSRKAL